MRLDSEAGGDAVLIVAELIGQHGPTAGGLFVLEQRETDARATTTSAASVAGLAQRSPQLAEETTAR